MSKAKAKATAPAGLYPAGVNRPLPRLGPPRILYRRLDAHPRFAVCCVVTT